jgi:hypothetical protein
MLNSWDGEFYIDEENGTIMSTMVGAGFKDVNNTFSGVLMGDVQGGASVQVDKDSGVGVYGFNQGEQSFGFNIKGTAFIGKAGRGRIYFDGNNGTIQSGAFRKPDKAEKGAEGAGAGMLIDLDGDDNSTGKGSFSSALFAYGEGGSFELNTRGGKSLLEIRSGPYTDSGVLIHIGNTTNKDFYIQSYDFNRSNKVGTRFDLETGTYESYYGETGKKSWVKIDPKGADGYFIIHDAGRENENILHCSSSTFYLQSVNYKEKDTGMKIDLRAGTIDARAGYIGGWEITKSQLKAGNIIIDSAGSISANGDAGAWSIKSDGSATFTQISITGDKVSNIGPFVVSTTALTYTSGSMVFKLGTDGLSLNGNAFKVGLNGNVDTAGNVHIAGNLTVDGANNKIKLSDGNSSVSCSGGGSVGGGTWNCNDKEGYFGVWYFDEEKLYTTTGSELGTSGSIILKNSDTQYLHLDGNQFKVTAGTTTQIMHGTYFSVSIGGGGSQLVLGNANGFKAIDDSGNGVTVNDSKAEIKAGSSKLLLNNAGGFELTDGSTTLKSTSDSLTIDSYTIESELKTYTFKTSWLKKASFQVYKGFIVKIEDEQDESEEDQLGDLAWLDKVVISSATFNLGSSAISMSQSTDGDTATFTGSIPVSQETYSLRGSRIYGLYTREYNSTTGEYEYSSYSGSAYSSGGSVTVNTVSSTSLTATIKVEAVKND